MRGAWFKGKAAAALCVAAALGLAAPAAANECDAQRGQKIEVLVPLDQNLAQAVETLVMGPDAVAYSAPLQPGDNRKPEAVVKLPKDGAHQITIRKLEGVWVFTTTTADGETGSLAARLPRTMEISSKDSGKRSKGKVLMRNEWRLTSPVVADGMFASDAKSPAQARLVFSGLGDLCPSGDAMTEWRLDIVTTDRRWRIVGKLI